MKFGVRIGLVAGMLGVLAASQARAATQNQWVQYGPNNTVLLRSVSPTDTACPAASIDGTAVTLSPRFTAAQDATATGGNFSAGVNTVLMCEASMPINYAQHVATIDGVALKMPVATPKRILFVGDTGCRVNGSANQACNDPVQFPLAFLASYAAIFKPDLIVHDGDFYYRERACPAGDGGCAGSPTGDNWTSWDAEWFGPAKPLIAAAPLAITRGNHESCGRGAKGWFSLLDVHPYDTAAVSCTGPTNHTGPLTAHDYTDPYFVAAGQVQLMMFDSSIANDSTPDSTVGPIFANQITTALGTLPANADVLYVTHKPTYAILAQSGTNYSGGDATEQSVFESLGGVPAQIKLLVSGHDHQFQMVNLSSASSQRYAPQMVIGNSGTLLDNQAINNPNVGDHQTFTPDTTGNAAGGTYNIATSSTTTASIGTVTGSADRAQYGFAVLDATSNGYVANVYTLGSNRSARCVVTFAPFRNMACAH